MSRRSDPIALAEQEVAEARTAALAEFAAARAKVRRLVVSPVFIGGVLLGAVAVGYLAFRRGKRNRGADSKNPGAWTLAVRTGQVLVPLLVALTSAISAARRPGNDRNGSAR